MSYLVYRVQWPQMEGRLLLGHGVSCQIAPSIGRITHRAYEGNAPVSAEAEQAILESVFARSEGYEHGSWLPSLDTQATCIRDAACTVLVSFRPHDPTWGAQRWLLPRVRASRRQTRLGFSELKNAHVILAHKYQNNMSAMPRELEAAPPSQETPHASDCEVLPALKAWTDLADLLSPVVISISNWLAWPGKVSAWLALLPTNSLEKSPMAGRSGHKRTFQATHIVGKFGLSSRSARIAIQVRSQYCIKWLYKLYEERK